MSNDDDRLASLPTHSSAQSPPPFLPLGPQGSATSQTLDATLSASGVPERWDHTYPPIPSYNTLYPTNDVSTTNEAPIPSPPTVANAEFETTPAIEVPDDLQQYTVAHDHTETGVAPRLPEAFPTDLLSLGSSEGPPETLPSYRADEPPQYTRTDIENERNEPETLAMHFFKYGFFFPAFWVFGAMMLITPLRSPNPLSPASPLSVWPPNSAFVAWCNEHVRTEADKEAFLARMQEVEMKWARRCLLALGGLVCLMIAIGVTIFGVLKVKDL